MPLFIAVKLDYSDCRYDTDSPALVYLGKCEKDSLALAWDYFYRKDPTLGHVLEVA